MQNYPIRCLPKTINLSIKHLLITSNYFDVPGMPTLATVSSAINYYNILPPNGNMSPFIIKVANLKNHLESTIEMGGPGDSLPCMQGMEVKCLPLEKNMAIISGYLFCKRSSISVENVSIVMHSSQMPKEMKALSISDRERRILFCFGTLKEGCFRKESLIKLDVKAEEIKELVNKGLLKKANNSYLLTMLADFNKLTKISRATIDQW